ncbi:outer membrane protein transport protein [Aromatoleum toluclasticum]|uniref:OmpP1/FadL family transporter n=1 Tax=Aromatoleum toluclasticum TaxID=92003 RepID=UPI001D185AB8|nr:outer membrane protein transport protein [Aromatoleum toluclasticum]MCC4114987.1 outer membrane protein transport protein [Aromatoleum toluclasticum]
MQRCRYLPVALAGLCLAPQAQATNVFRFEGYGPVSRAMGGTAAAHDVGNAALMANPATLGLSAEGGRFELGLDLVVTDIEADNLATGERARSSRKDLASAYYAPQLSYVHRAGALTWGAGVFAGAGLGTEYGSRSFLSRTPDGSATGLENASRLLVLEVPAGVSYAVSDRLEVGASVEAVWAGINLELLLGADQAGALIGQNRARGSLVPVLGGIPGLQGAHFSLSDSDDVRSGVDAWGWGGRLGATFRASERTRIGAYYTLKTRLEDLKGRARLTAVSSVAGQIPLTGNIRIIDFQLPDALTIGVAHQATERLLLAADLSRVRWKEAMKDIKVRYESDGGGDLDIRLPQDYRDINVLNLGAAYRIGRWTLRAGASFAGQAIPDDRLFAVVPATPTKHASVGFSYDLGKSGSVNVAYSHAFRETMTNRQLPNTSAPIRVEHAQDNLVVNYSYRF